MGFATAVAVSAFAVTIAAGAGAAALASTSSHVSPQIGQGRAYTYTLNSTGVQVPDGYSQFYPSSSNHGGMEYRGTLKDTKSDGDSVYVQAEVEGYSYGGRVSNTAGNGTSKGYDQVSYDPAAIYVNSGNVEACRNVSLGSDNCQATVQLNR